MGMDSAPAGAQRMVPGAPRAAAREHQRRMRRLGTRFDELNRIRRMVDVSGMEGRRTGSNRPVPR